MQFVRVEKSVVVRNVHCIVKILNDSESFLPICGRFGFNMSHSILNTLKRYVKRGKDDLEVLSHQDIVYKITCNDCEATYIEQTKRQLSTHKHVIDKKSGSLSVIYNRLENHKMNWNDVKIVANESFYSKRLISEMIHVKKQLYGLNKQSNTDLLSDTFLPIMELISRT